MRDSIDISHVVRESSPVKDSCLEHTRVMAPLRLYVEAIDYKFIYPFRRMDKKRLIL